MKFYSIQRISRKHENGAKSTCFGPFFPSVFLAIALPTLLRMVRSSIQLVVESAVDHKEPGEWPSCLPSLMNSNDDQEDASTCWDEETVSLIWKPTLRDQVQMDPTFWEHPYCVAPMAWLGKSMQKTCTFCALKRMENELREAHHLPGEEASLPATPPPVNSGNGKSQPPEKLSLDSPFDYFATEPVSQDQGETLKITRSK